ncbi:pirin family protein [Plantibacter flavus]|uniref:pirin family protein n=1 Tax=Plantibacter flavus TaxID=150123 RepID=UPI00237932AE|nr:pirin family protein [Plantibacter flavus]MDD9151997.1 pirin family protein [Plantibacter flavus]
MTRLDADPVPSVCHAPDGSGTRLLEAREVPLGGVRGLSVHRTLPQRELPMIGAWCFLDRFDEDRSLMRVLPHPHTGLQTVTWPLVGDIRHRDSVGSDVVVRPGELNLMTSGRGVSHSEFSVGEEAAAMHGLQLWVALPEAAAQVPAAFEQHTDLPVHRAPGLEATVLVGTLGGVTSTATVHSPLLGADVTLEADTVVEVPVDPAFEHGVLVLDGALEVGGVELGSGPLLYLAPGCDRLELRSASGARFVLLGGTPFPEELVMWWNFVGRSHEDIASAREDWEAGSPRFGSVAGHGTDRIPAPPLPNVRLTPRRRSI